MASSIWMWETTDAGITDGGSDSGFRVEARTT